MLPLHACKRCSSTAGRWWLSARAHQVLQAAGTTSGGLQDLLVMLCVASRGCSSSSLLASMSQICIGWRSKMLLPSSSVVLFWRLQQLWRREVLWAALVRASTHRATTGQSSMASYVAFERL
jgi:hypothetical protein